jgi:hypothetical protein
MAGGITAAVIGGTALVGSAYLSSQGAQSAADAQANAQMQAANTQAGAALAQQNNLLAAGKQAASQFTPYSTTGQTYLNSLAQNNAYFNHQFDNTDLNANLAPNYSFILGQGQNATNQMSNATGGYNSGNAAKALQDYTQNYASNAYQNAFNNYNTQRGNISAIDLSGSNLGLSGATGAANATLGTSTNIANLGIGAANATAAGITGSAAANAAGIIGSSNAYAGAAQGIGGLGYSYLNSMNNATTNNGGSYSDFGAGTGQAGNSGFTPTAGNSFTFNTGS